MSFGRLAHRTDFAGRQVRFGDIAEVGILQNNQFHKLGETRSWSWQQGAMLQWFDDDQGKHSNASFSASIRRNKDAFKQTLQALVGRKCVYKLTLISGIEYIIGSREYVPKFTYSDGVSGLSSSEFTINIENESIHGLLVNSAG